MQLAASCLIGSTLACRCMFAGCRERADLEITFASKHPMRGANLHASHFGTQMARDKNDTHKRSEPAPRAALTVRAQCQN